MSTTRAGARRRAGDVRRQRQQQDGSGGCGGAPPAVAELPREREQAHERFEDAIHQPR